jgi:hypothetical protein
MTVIHSRLPGCTDFGLPRLSEPVTTMPLAIMPIIKPVSSKFQISGRSMPYFAIMFCTSLNFSMMNESKIVLKTRRDFAEEIFVALIEGGRKGHPGVESVAPTHSTWPSILRAAIQHTRGSFATRAQWVSGIAAAMVSASIEWVPGSHRRRLTHQQVVQLVGAAASATVNLSTARPLAGQHRLKTF